MLRYAAFIFLTCLTSVGSVRAVLAPETGPRPDVDVRLERADDTDGFVLRAPRPAQVAAAAQLRALVGDLVLRWDGVSGAPRWVAAAPGSVLWTGPGTDPEATARRFLEAHAVLLGVPERTVRNLETGSVVPAPRGGAHVHFVQRFRGLEVFGGRVLVNVRGDGAVTSFGARLFHGGPWTLEPALDAEAAVRTALSEIYPETLFTGVVRSAEPGGERRTVFDGTGFWREPSARLTIFPQAEGARLAWSVRAAEPTLFTDYEALIDAVDGSLLLRRNRTLYAKATILDAHQPSPQSAETAPAAYVTVEIPGSTAGSPNGWIDPPGTRLTGNNATGHEPYYTAPPPSATDAIYDFPFNTAVSSVVNAWWWSNDAHDRFRAAGFDEAAGNYQKDNFGLGGLGSDPMEVTMLEGDRNTAFYTPSIDGGTSTINFAWAGCDGECGDHDGYPANGGERSTGYQRDVVYHEYAHGVTVRMVGGPADDSCLYGLQSGAMGEGWSDLFAGAFSEDPQIGDAFLVGNGWLRDLRHDLNYGDLCEVGDQGCRVHNDGMIWGGTLWELRRSMVALDPTGGADDFLAIVLEGLASTVCAPSMLDARDGILAADTALFGSAHHDVLWSVFASRGMGENASSTGEADSAPVVDFAVPAVHECAPPPMPEGLAVDATGPNEITLTYEAIDAAAVQILRRDVASPATEFAWIDSTPDTSAYIDRSVEGGRDYEYRVVGLGPGGTPCAGPGSDPDQTTATGSCTAGPDFVPDLTISDLDVCAVRLSWTSAMPGCPAAPQPIVYNVYASWRPGFEPGERHLIGRTASTTFDVTTSDSDRAPFFLVTAQHGTLDDPADHRRREPRQVLDWEPRVPTAGRAPIFVWDFDSGDQGWTVNNVGDPSGGWTLTSDPTGTRYGGTWLSPEDPSRGVGQSWVTGEPAGASGSVTAFDSDSTVLLISPEWDATGGATLLGFDYWFAGVDRISAGPILQVSDGFATVAVDDVRMMGGQRFETDSRHGWQRFEIDLAEVMTPTATMSVRFATDPGDPLSEFGIDHVTVEQFSSCGTLPDVQVDSVAVDDGAPGWGNGNGLLEPGETARLIVTAINDGAAIAGQPTGTLVAVPDGVTVHEASDDFPTLSLGGTGVSSGAGFTVTLSEAVDCGGAMEFQWRFETLAGQLSTDRWVTELGAAVRDVLLDDDFETDLGWQANGDPGLGIWERGDPVGTTNGTDQANPEFCAGGTNCFVTENGATGGDPNASDVDGTGPILFGPPLDLTGYKRSYLTYDLWSYDDSDAVDFVQDYVRYGALVDEPILGFSSEDFEFGRTSGWESRTLETTVLLPHAPNVRVFFQAVDRDESFDPGATDHVVEMGVDNVVFEADRFVCLASGFDPPNGIGGTLLADRTPDGVSLDWTASPTDTTHDAAAYYELYVSGVPDSGFSVADTATGTTISRPTLSSIEFYRIVAVNAAGSSGDEPVP